MEILPYELHYWAHISRLPVIVAQRALLRAVGGLNMYHCDMAEQGGTRAPMGEAVWKGPDRMGIYVVQVAGGQEAKAVEMIAGVAQGIVQDCFAPRREVMRRIDGAWQRKCEKLFPGYVFVQTDDPVEVQRLFRVVPTFTRMLGSAGDTFLPLTPDEVTWINIHTNAETHVVEMSEGIIDGDRVVVTSGPLKGHEASITRIDRHKRLAWVDMDMFGRHKTIRVGLEIVSKK